MTISTTTNKISYTADGSQSTFAYNFKIFNDSDLEVYVRESNTDVLKSNYTVTGAGEANGGTITFIAPYKPSNGQIVTLTRQLDIIQDTDYVANDPFPAEAHEDALDYRCAVEQQIEEMITRNITVPIGDQATDLELPNEETRANRYFIFDANGNVTVSINTISGTTLEHSSLNALLEDDHLQYLTASGVGGRTTFTTNWNDLTDGGNTTLHIHDSRYYTETESDVITDAIAADLAAHEADSTIHFTEASIDHDNITNTHNLTTDINHNTITNNHNLTTDIDHNSITNNHNLTTDIDHDQLTNFTADEHFTQAAISITESQISDLDKYSTSEVDTISGSLQDQIDNVSPEGAYLPLTLTGSITTVDLDNNDLYIMNGANDVARFYSLGGGAFKAYHGGDSAFVTTDTGVIMNPDGDNTTYVIGNGLYKSSGSGFLQINSNDSIKFTAASGIDFNDQVMENVPTPTVSGHAANKGYVDAQIATVSGIGEGGGSIEAAHFSWEDGSTNGYTMTNVGGLGWQTCLLNTTTKSTTNITRTLSQITLQTGTYLVSVLCPRIYGTSNNNVAMRLYDFTNTTALTYAYQWASPISSGNLFGIDNFPITIVGSTILELQVTIDAPSSNDITFYGAQQRRTPSTFYYYVTQIDIRKIG